MYHRNTSRGRLLMAAAVAALACPIGALGQTTTLSPQEVLRLPPAAQLVVPSVGDETCNLPPALPLLAGEKASLPVTAIKVEGNTQLDTSLIEQEWGPLLGQKTSAEALSRLVERVACRYRERGFVFARATVTQTDDKGSWRVNIMEGRLAKLEVAIDDENAAGFVRRAFASVREGQPINADDVRRGLVLARSYGLTDIRPTVRRSRSEPGALDLVIVAQAAPSRFFFAGDNYGSRQIGRWGALAGIEFSGLTPLYERTSIGFYRTLESAEQTTAQISSRALLSETGVGASVDFAYSHALPRADLAPLEIDANTYYGRVGLEYPVVVQRGLIATAKLGFEYLDQKTELFTNLPFVSDRLRIVSLNLEGAGLSLLGAWTANAELRQGVHLLAASRAGDTLLSRANSNPQAFSLRGGASLTHQFPYLTATFTLRGQYAPNRLVSFEQFTVGTLNSGRGYDPSAFTGDRGIGGSLDLTGPAFSLASLGLPETIRIAPLAFVDTGRLWDVHGTGAKNGSSGGGGVAIGLARGVALQAVYAQPFGVNGALKGSYGSRFLLRLTASVDAPFQQVSDLIADKGSKP